MPEEGENYIRIPVVTRQSDDKIVTIVISSKEGIKALYSSNRKLILTYLFEKAKGWTMEKAKKWVEDHKKEINMEKIELKAEIEEVEGKQMAVATSEALDRDGDILPIDKWDLTNFKKNPVLQFAHDYRTPPIGKAINLRIEGKRMLFEPVFHGLTQLSREIEDLYRQGFMKAFSVGFLQNAEGRLELVEISAVPVPSNPEALMLAKSLENKDDEKIEEVKKWLEAEIVEKSIEPEIKSGKVLSKKNVGIIKDAVFLLNQLVEEVEKTDEPKKASEIDIKAVAKEKLETPQSKGRSAKETLKKETSDDTLKRALKIIAGQSAQALNIINREKQ